MRKRWNNKSVLFSIPSGSVQYLKIYTVFILIFKQWQLDALHNGSSLLHWAILKVSARSSDVLYHIYRPRCCHIPSLATNGSSAPVCLSVCLCLTKACCFPSIVSFHTPASLAQSSCSGIRMKWWEYICSTRCQLRSKHWFCLSVQMPHLWLNKQFLIRILQSWWSFWIWPSANRGHYSEP